MRGNKLFAGSRMILPEHKERIRIHQTEADRIVKPLLDEQRWEEMERAIAEAWNLGALVYVTSIHNGKKYSVKGRIYKIHSLYRQLHLIDEENQRVLLLFDDIIGINVNGSLD